jgi:hypothetical protein
MAKVVGDIAVQVGADVSPLQRGMKKGGKSVQDFQDRAQKMAINVVKAGAAVVTAMAAIAAGVLKAASEAAAAGKEIQNLANVAGTSTTEFQRLAIASASVGIEQQKLSDIFKDVNDKFGDYMATGAGPLADFFENIAPAIGVTAEQFAKLSGPEALQLYVTSLERAGLSQQQMTFYMEALASDTTALVPLLQDGGRAMRELGDEAESAGRILSQDMIDAAVELDRELVAMTDTLKTQAITAVLEYKDEILAAAEFITGTLIPAMGSIIGAATDFAAGLEPATKALKEFLMVGNAVLLQDGTQLDGGPTSGTLGIPGAGTNGQAPSDAEAAALLELYGSGVVSPENLVPVDEPLEVLAPVEHDFLPTDTPPVVPLVRPDDSSGGGSRSRGGGGGSRNRGPDREDLESLQERYASEAEQLDIHLASEMEKLEEYREAKLGSEEEFNALEKQIRDDHLRDMADLEEAAQRARLQSIGGAFGDLAGLMTSENAKLFKIGQASAIAEATVSGYQAAVDAWQKGMAFGGPPVAAAFAGASVIKTGALINQIASASPTGGGGGNANAGGGGVPAVAAQGPLQVQLSGLGSNDLLRGADVGMLLDRLNDEAGDRGLIMTVAK